MENESNNGKVPLISKIAYGFGDVEDVTLAGCLSVTF